MEAGIAGHVWSIDEAPKVSPVRMLMAVVSIAVGSYLGGLLGFFVTCDLMVASFPGHLKCLIGVFPGLLLGGSIAAGVFGRFVGIRVVK